MSAVRAGAARRHTPRVVLVATLAVLLAFLVQTAVLPAVGLSAAVPVVFATTVVLAMAWGRTAGAAIGFAAGLALDLTGTGVLGVGALVGCVTGWLAAGIPTDRWRWSGLGWAVLATVLAAAADAGLNAVLQGRLPLGSPAWLWVGAGALVCVATLLPARGWLGEVVR